MTTKALVFDVETTDMWSNIAAEDHPNQPWPAQYAAQVVDLDTWEVLAQCSYFLALPDGVTVAEGAAKVTGITTEKCRDAGYPPRLVSATHSNLVAKADVLVGHNLEFDYRVMWLLQKRLAPNEPQRMFGKAQICTMKMSAPIVKLPPTERMRKFKPEIPFKAPKLSEAYEFVTAKPLDGAHDAMVDVQACATVLRYLVENGHVKDF